MCHRKSIGHSRGQRSVYGFVPRFFQHRQLGRYADSYYRVDANLSWYSPSQDIRVIMSGKNLTDEETWVSLNRLNEFGAISGYANDPLTYSLEVQYTF